MREPGMLTERPMQSRQPLVSDARRERISQGVALVRSRAPKSRMAP